MSASLPEPDGQARSFWLAALQARPPAGELGPLQLAWLGDAVWELHQRLERCRTPARAKQLHGQVVDEVCAEAQARVLAQLADWLTPSEAELVRRARNRSGRGPRGSDAATYARATGFEALLGWLFLHDPPRLVELLDHLQHHTS